ncbi:MAG: CDP-alcohol phosphatidyltransferase family protein [Planctomycetaceae bacterium]
MTRGQQWRGRWLAALLDGLTRCGATADHVTLLSLAAGLAAGGLWFVNPVLALVGLVLHVLLDGLDGPLARRQRVASPRGSFTDTMADQLVVTALIVALMCAGRVSASAGSLFTVLYCAVALFAMARNALQRPYTWVVRPRFLVYAWLPLEIWVRPGSLDGLLWLCNLGLAVSAAAGFFAIRNSLERGR